METREQLMRVVLSFHYVGSSNQSEISRVGNKCLHLLSHVVGQNRVSTLLLSLEINPYMPIMCNP